MSRESCIAVLLLSLMSISAAQRGSYAGSSPHGYPVIITTTAEPTTSALGDRFGNDNVTTTTPRLPAEANGDQQLVNTLRKLPKDQQPFWLLNWEALEEERRQPKTYDVKSNGYIDFGSGGNRNLPAVPDNRNFQQPSILDSRNTQRPMVPDNGAVQQQQPILPDVRDILQQQQVTPDYRNQQFVPDYRYMQQPQPTDYRNTQQQPPQQFVPDYRNQQQQPGFVPDYRNQQLQPQPDYQYQQPLVPDYRNQQQYVPDYRNMQQQPQPFVPDYRNVQQQQPFVPDYRMQQQPGNMQSFPMMPQKDEEKKSQKEEGKKTEKAEEKKKI